MAGIERGGKDASGLPLAPAEESVDEDIKMENARTTYDLFIQNSLKRTSHSLEWYNNAHQDKDHPEFDWNYFLIGTHQDEGVEDETKIAEKLQLVRARVPNKELNIDELGDLAKFQKNLSRLEVVCEFDHQDEVIKARSMPQDLRVVASMTNSGIINLYNMPELANV
jgi:hypothetical protein